ncbi:nucleotide exchange factor GrpE [Jannaschia aquimarina]|uniref:Protein GrpE n=1 Tax=Jannaschia aquimarina TaxID=935700 RepID=A0A0D1CJS1_9RHOB|nr:nucleotide exchange factor GrpE [Jannaschia aquimarina]KIT14977.1 Protein GrpE [Jannaschia aquimarina]SNS61016.1 molecular chaperone GrpE [Jannaschia aquimarina]
MGEPKDDFLDDPEAMDEEFDLDAAMEEDADGPRRPANIDTILAERDEMKDRLMRALAEAENVRKRAARDREEAATYGGSRLARDLLPVYDNLKRAMDAVPEDQSAILEGLELTLRELTGTFEKHGVKVVAPAEGEKFDPQLHQAMFEAPVPGTKAGDIIQVMAEGFMLHERLLRPAQVGVSSTPAS